MSRTRIKTLAQIGDQLDRILDYLYARGRRQSAAKVQQIYDRILERVFESAKVDRIDDDTLGMICREPLIVGASY